MESPLLQKPLLQPVLSIELFISDLIEYIFRKLEKFQKRPKVLKKSSKRFPKSMNFPAKSKLWLEKIPKTGFLDWTRSFRVKS